VGITQEQENTEPAKIIIFAKEPLLLSQFDLPQTS